MPAFFCYNRMNVNELNARYGAPGRIVFREGFAGYPDVVIANKYGAATVVRRCWSGWRRRARRLCSSPRQGSAAARTPRASIPEMRPGNFDHLVVAEPGVRDNVTSEMDTAALRDNGASRPNGPRCTVKEMSGVKVLARYASDGLPAIAERRDADCRRIYVCEPGGLTPGLLNRLVRESGGYAATDRPGLQVNMNGDFISVHCL